MNRIWRFVTTRVFVTFLMVFVEILLMLFVLYIIGNGFLAIEILLYGFSFLMALFVINRIDNPAYKLGWVIVIMALPLAGGVLYLIFGKHHTTKEMRNYFHYDKRVINSMSFVKSNINLKSLDDPSFLKLAKRLNSCGQASFSNTKSEFLSPGQEKFEKMLIDLKAAKKFIFLEYFIISPGHMWSEIVEILINKVKEGVDVRLIYDDFGTIQTLPNDYSKTLEKMGIKTKVFNVLKPHLNAFMNNRDHRKILIIDGDIGYTGGINLADEYINKKERFGYWKDCAIRINGEAVQSLTALFLTMWHYLTGDSLTLKDYLPTIKEKNDGIVTPFGDNPVSKDRIAQSIYLQIVENAQKYVYIETPYLVMDNELTTSLKIAAQSGVDVRIITPHIPDKFYVFALTRSSYRELIEAGVSIYEFTPGFIHSKVIISDDKIGVVGTSNFDFRSLYLHFECGVLLYKTNSLSKIYNDFLEILKKSQHFTLKDCDNLTKKQKLLAFILKPFAPLV